MSTETPVLVDGKSFYFMRKAGTNIDYEQLTKGLQEIYDVGDCNYYAVIPSSDPRPLHNLLSWLRHNGWKTLTAKSRSQNDHVDVSTKMAADAVGYSADGANTVIIASSNVNMMPVVKKCQQYGTNVVVASTEEKVDPRLKLAADEFFDISRFQMESTE